MSYEYKYPRPAVTADAVVITKKEPQKVLLIERGGEPFKGCWAFPGGFMNMDETAEQCAFRELEEETGLQLTEAKQIGCYSDVDRDPRGRTLSVAYLMLVEDELPVKGLDDAKQAKWWPLNDLPELAFDHSKILNETFRTLK
jgi:8-oxo-dGTP diphosphatase